MCTVVSAKAPARHEQNLKKNLKLFIKKICKDMSTIYNVHRCKVWGSRPSWAHLIAKKTTHYYTHKINIKTPTNTNEHNSSTLSPCQIRSGGCPVEWPPPSWGQFHHCIWSSRCQGCLNVCVHFLCVHCIMRHQCHQYIGCHWWGLTWLTRPYFLHDISSPVKRRLSVELLKETE